jgi:hypothetical protein
MKKISLVIICSLFALTGYATTNNQILIAHNAAIESAKKDVYDISESVSFRESRELSERKDALLLAQLAELKRINVGVTMLMKKQADLQLKLLNEVKRISVKIG